MHVLAIADTHVDDQRGIDRLLDRLAEQLAAADAVLHAGDVTAASVLDALGSVAPQAALHAVRGNNDRRLDRPEELAVELGGVRVAMVHDSGPKLGRARRLRRRFPDADVVVFGHSHLPWHETHVERGHVQHHVNPGSATQRRRAPTCTVAWLDLVDGTVVDVRHEPVG